MCTVTYIPVEEGCYLTSNRNEQLTRSRAVQPLKYDLGHAILMYPKDPDGQGSWIAVKNNNDVAVLLNGAFVKTISKPPYPKSRGLVLLEIIGSEHPELYFETTNQIYYPFIC